MCIIFVRYHLQALRHMYVLATEPRVLVTIDSETGKACSVPVCVTASHGNITAMSPCIVPSWENISEVMLYLKYLNVSLNTH